MDTVQERRPLDQTFTRRQMFEGLGKLVVPAVTLAACGPVVVSAPSAAPAKDGTFIPSAAPARSAAPAPQDGAPNPNRLKDPTDLAIFEAWKKLVQVKEFQSAGVTAKLLDYQEPPDGSIIAVWTARDYTKKVQFRGFHTELNPFQIGLIAPAYAQTTSHLLEYEWRQAGLLKDKTFGPFKNWEGTLDAVGCYKAQGVNTPPQCTAARALDGLAHIIFTGISY